MSGPIAHRASCDRASGRTRAAALGAVLVLLAMALPAHAAPPSSWWWRGATDLYTLMGVDLSDAGGPGYVPTGVDALGVGRASVFAMAVGRPSVLATAKRDQLTGDTSVMWSEAPWPGETPGPVRWSSVHGLLVGSVVQDGLAQRPQVISVPFDDAGPATATQLGPWPAGVGEITALAVLDDGTPLALDGPHATVYRYGASGWTPLAQSRIPVPAHGVAVRTLLDADGCGAEVWMSLPSIDVIQRYSACDGTPIGSFGGSGRDMVSLGHPTEMAGIPGTDLVAVADTFNNRVVISRGGAVHVDALEPPRGFTRATTLDVGPDGTIYVADGANVHVWAPGERPGDRPWDLYLQDHPDDDGSEPGVETPVFASPSIIVRHEPDLASGAASFDTESQALLRNSAVSVYVRVHNRGIQPSPAAVVRLGWYDPDAQPGRVGLTDVSFAGVDEGERARWGPVQRVPAIEPGASVLVGPFRFDPPGEARRADELRLVASVAAEDDLPSVTWVEDAARDNNVAVRDVHLIGSRPDQPMNTLVVTVRFPDDPVQARRPAGDVHANIDDMTIVPSRRICAAMDEWASAVSWGRTGFRCEYAEVSLRRPYSDYLDETGRMRAGYEMTALSAEVLRELVGMGQAHLLHRNTPGRSDDPSHLLLVVRERVVDASTVVSIPGSGLDNRSIEGDRSRGERYRLELGAGALIDSMTLAVSVLGDEAVEDGLVAHAAGHHLAMLDQYAAAYGLREWEGNEPSGWDPMAMPPFSVHATLWHKVRSGIVDASRDVLFVPWASELATEGEVRLLYTHVDDATAMREPGDVRGVVFGTPGGNSLDFETAGTWIEARWQGMEPWQHGLPQSANLSGGYGGALAMTAYESAAGSQPTLAMVERPGGGDARIRMSEARPVRDGLTVAVDTEPIVRGGQEVGIVVRWSAPPAGQTKAFDLVIGTNDNKEGPLFWIDPLVGEHPLPGDYATDRARLTRALQPSEWRDGEDHIAWVGVTNRGAVAVEGVNVELVRAGCESLRFGTSSCGASGPTFELSLEPRETALVPFHLSVSESEGEDAAIIARVWAADAPSSETDPFNNTARLELRREVSVPSIEGGLVAIDAVAENRVEGDTVIRPWGLPIDWKTVWVRSRRSADNEEGTLYLSPPDDGDVCETFDVTIDGWRTTERARSPIDQRSMQVSVGRVAKVSLFKVGAIRCRDLRDEDLREVPSWISDLDACSRIDVAMCVGNGKEGDSITVQWSRGSVPFMSRDLRTDAAGCVASSFFAGVGDVWDVSAAYAGNACTAPTVRTDSVTPGLGDSDDADKDGWPDTEEWGGDFDRDGVPNRLDPDSDGDGIKDGAEAGRDCDADGIPDALDTPCDDSPDPAAAGGDGPSSTLRLDVDLDVGVAPIDAQRDVAHVHLVAEPAPTHATEGGSGCSTARPHPAPWLALILPAWLAIRRRR